MSDDTLLPDPTQAAGAEHPRAARQLFGHAAAEADFITARDSGRLHSGWLISGPNGIGKATLAYRLAKHLLAQSLEADDPDIRLIEAGTHPRLLTLKRGPNDKGDKLETVISVKAVRKLKDFLGLSAADGGWRVVIVDCADDLNDNAANALLKNLEEPPPRTVFLLIAHQPSKLLPTIRSRCRVLRLAPLPPYELENVLQTAGLEAPTAALALAQGSAGRAIRLLNDDGLPLYRDLVALFARSSQINRAAAIALSDSITGKANEGKFELLLELIEIFLARTAQAGLFGPPALEAAPHEAELLARLCPHDGAARKFAALEAALSARARHGQSVNLDPSMLILDMLLQIESAAQRSA